MLVGGLRVQVQGVGLLGVLVGMLGIQFGLRAFLALVLV